MESLMKKILYFLVYIVTTLILIMEIQSLERYIERQNMIIKRYENFLISYGIATIDTIDNQLIANKKVLSIIKSYWRNK